MSFDRRFINAKLSIKGIINTPPTNVVAGDQFIVGANPTGAFENAVVNSIAVYNSTSWKFIPPNTNNLEVLNLETSEILGWNGSAWVALVSIEKRRTPVLNVVATGSSLPANAEQGEKFLNTDDGRIYTATDADTWDDGVATVDGDSYVSLTDKKLYVNSDGELSAENIPDGSIFLNKSDGLLWYYNETANKLVKLSIPEVHTSITEYHTLIAAEATAKSFTLNHSIASGTESSVLLAVCGIIQNAGSDFVANGNSISWDNKELENIGLIEGDIFTVHYLF